MTTTKWQLETPIDAIVFDCDGTLSQLEGIDELAKIVGKGDVVEALTAEAMGKSGLTLELYHQRLDLVRPTREQVLALAQHYYQHRVPDVARVIALLKRIGKTVYLMSAGLSPSVKAFGELLSVPPQHIFAVDIHFDEQGNYLNFDRTSPLVTRLGKREIIQQLKSTHETIIHIGDGLNDYAVYDLVTRFIGFGGIYYRENIENACEYYIKTHALAPLLPLILTQQEYEQLTPDEKQLYQQGLECIKQGQVTTDRRDTTLLAHMLANAGRIK